MISHMEEATGPDLSSRKGFFFSILQVIYWRMYLPITMELVFNACTSAWELSVGVYLFIITVVSLLVFQVVFAYSLFCPVLVHGQLTIIFVVSVCLVVCAEFLSAVFDPISIKLGHMLYVWVYLCPENIGAVQPQGAAWPLKTSIFRGFGAKKNYLVLQFWSDCPDFWLYCTTHQY